MTALAIPLTETQILKARYDEARQIKDAWDWRLKLAQLEHSDAFHHGGDTEATRRNITAVEINVADAAVELQVALESWMSPMKPAVATRRPPSQERLDHAGQLLRDGASQREVQRTTGIARETLRKHFPGTGWTFKEGGDFRALTSTNRDNPWNLSGRLHNWAEGS